MATQLQYYGTGRRKSAVARVFLRPGKGQIMVNGKLVDLRVPYPMGFFTKNVDGRIDDPNGGWKGRGLWTTSGTRTVFHSENGTKDSPKVFKLQMRPDPLAR